MAKAYRPNQPFVDDLPGEATDNIQWALQMCSDAFDDASRRLAAAGSSDNGDPPTPVARTHSGTRTVLVVDDEKGIRELARKLLQLQGYTVLIAADADEALRLFEGNPSIDLVLTDVAMPGGSGPELITRLLEQRPALKVIYMSGYSKDTVGDHGIVKGGIAFLNKPFTADTLGRKIREALDR